MATTGKSLVFAAALLGLALSLGSGCGGSTTSGGGAGSGGSAGSGTGGTGASASGGSGGSGAFAGSGNYGACDFREECALFPTNCCGYCGPHPITGFIAINTSYSGAVQRSLCGDEPPICPACASYPDPNQLALCRAGQCQAVQLQDDELSACQNDNDCKLRWGSACCECGGGDPNQLVAVNGRADAAFCSGGGCAADCAAPPYPADAVALCVQNHCRVEFYDTAEGG